MATQIPLTPMVKRYKHLGLLSQRKRLAEAHKLITNPGPLAKDFAASIRRFRSYSNVGEDFYTERKLFSVKAPQSEIKTTHQLTALVKRAHTVRVLGDQALNFSYVDRELVAARTTGGAVFDDGSEARTALRLDLLLANATDRTPTPIVAEVKVAMDMDPFFALIQGLTLAAHLATGPQRKRLHRRYGLATAGKLDVYIISAQPPGFATYWFELRDAADSLAAVLIGRRDVSQHIRRIAALDADLVDKRFRVTKRFAYPRW
ncbi:MAG: hypothetical protein AABM43_05115 [Actinomycetota bacterium]